MSKPINISINPSIDTDPSKTFILRIEGDKGKIFNLLDHAEDLGCDSYEIVDSPAGVDISSHECKEITKQPIKGFYATIRYYDEDISRRVFIAQTLDLGEDHPEDPDVFYYAGDHMETSIRLAFSFNPASGNDWYIVPEQDNGCGCYNDPPCKGCVPKTYLPDEPSLSEVPVDDDANLLNLFKVYTINDDTSETDPRYIMALTEEGAAVLYHKARAREHGNYLCEIIVSKLADAEVCDG